MNWIPCAAGLASASMLGAMATQPQGQPPQVGRPHEAQVQHPLERSPQWSEDEITRPGDHHQILDPVIGQWTALVTIYREGEVVAESRGTLQNDWVLGDRFIRGVYTAEEEDGERTQGISFVGYNNAADRYEATWMDTDSTEIMTAHGHLEPRTRVLTFHGNYTCTMTGAEVPTRIVAMMPTPDRIIWEMFEKPPGERAHKTMQIVYSRRHEGIAPRPGRPIAPGGGNPGR
jgi:hypothetical protein